MELWSQLLFVYFEDNLIVFQFVTFVKICKIFNKATSYVATTYVI